MKNTMTKNVDLYFIDGCGRCSLGGTPQCKVNTWRDELKLLRKILLDCGLQEEAKWGMPCYLFENKNIILLAAFKDFCSLNFFKGGLIQDTKGLLEKAGENSEASRLFKFTNVKEIIKHEKIIKQYIFEATEIERAGLKSTGKKLADYVIPEELQKLFSKNAAFKKAFNSLTPGRKKGYLIHFTQAKQSATRISRIEKCIPKIMQGIGFHDR